MAEIAIVVIDPAGNRSAQLVDNYAIVRNVIPMMVTRLGLPTELYYQLIPHGTNSKLPVDKSLVASAVRPGAELHLIPVRDTVFAQITRKLYDEAKDYASKKLWELARQKLDQLFRTFPEQPDPAGLLNIVPGYGVGSAGPGTAASGGGAFAAPAMPGAPAAGAATKPPPPEPSGGGFGCLLFLAVVVGGGIAAYQYRLELEQWWVKNRPEWAKDIGPKSGDAKDKKDANDKDAYGIFLVGKEEEVICGQRSVIEKTPKGNLHGWGLDNVTTVGQSGVELRMIRGPFATADETRKAYEAEKIVGSEKDMGIANYTKAKFRFDNKEHMIDNATRLLR